MYLAPLFDKSYYKNKNFTDLIQLSLCGLDIVHISIETNYAFDLPLVIAWLFNSASLINVLEKCKTRLKVELGPIFSNHFH